MFPNFKPNKLFCCSKCGFDYCREDHQKHTDCFPLIIEIKNTNLNLCSCKQNLPLRKCLCRTTYHLVCNECAAICEVCKREFQCFQIELKYINKEVKKMCSACCALNFISSSSSINQK